MSDRTTSLRSIPKLAPALRAEHGSAPITAVTGEALIDLVTRLPPWCCYSGSEVEGDRQHGEA
jgi:hypothetical protein